MAKKSVSEPVKLGFIGLAALVFGMMVGAGIFNIPQNMAVSASPAAVALSWLITAAGVLLLVFTFKALADNHPTLSAGIYQYAQQGFGNFAGFNIAWGYWLCTAFANVAYAVMLNDAFGAFFPSLLNHGWQTVAFGSALIWGIYAIVIAGLRSAKILTTLMAAVKISAILLIIALLIANFNLGTFSAHFWQNSINGTYASLGEQIKSTMLVTLWCFIGIEGAVIMSGRARRASDIGKAGVTGFFIAWLLYVLVSMLCFGVMSRAELGSLHDPSVAYVLRSCCGPWAYWLVIASVILSLGGGWLAWTVVCAEVPYSAARAGIFPRRFLRVNRHDMPAYGLAISSIVMQLFLILVVTADDVYRTALNITGMMILPAYLISGLYLFKTTHGIYKLTGAACAIFCLWMIYAGGLNLFFQTSLFYLAGIGFYIKAQREKASILFTRAETIALALLILSATAVLTL